MANRYLVKCTLPIKQLRIKEDGTSEEVTVEDVRVSMTPHVNTQREAIDWYRTFLLSKSNQWTPGTERLEARAMTEEEERRHEQDPEHPFPEF